MSFLNVRRGDIGVATAIGIFTELGYDVSIPFSGASPYDLVIAKGHRFSRVQVKTCTNVRNGHYRAKLASNQRRSSGNHVKSVDPLEVDCYCIIAGGCDVYFIPASLLEGKRDITLNSRWNEYKIV